MPDNDAWYFTLSAIPQTLAAVITLSAMFVVFKLDAVNERIERELAIVKRFLMPLRPQMEVNELEQLSAKDSLRHIMDGITELRDEHEPFKTTAKYEQLTAILTEVRDEHGHKYDVTRERTDLYIEQKRRYLTTLIAKRTTTMDLLEKSIIASVLPVALSIFILPNHELFLAFERLIINLLSLVAVFGICFTAYSVWRISKL